jgi:hypothetical protein
VGTRRHGGVAVASQPPSSDIGPVVTLDPRVKDVAGVLRIHWMGFVKSE